MNDSFFNFMHNRETKWRGRERKAIFWIRPHAHGFMNKHDLFLLQCLIFANQTGFVHDEKIVYLFCAFGVRHFANITIMLMLMALPLLQLLLLLLLLFSTRTDGNKWNCSSVLSYLRNCILNLDQWFARLARLLRLLAYRVSQMHAMSHSMWPISNLVCKLCIWMNWNKNRNRMCIKRPQTTYIIHIWLNLWKA